MRRIAVIDAETDPFRKGRVPRPFVWGYFDGTEYREFWGKHAAFIRFLKKQNVICYAHNGGKFDFHFLLGELSAYDDIMIINGRIARMHIGRAELRDSICILPVALAAYQKDKIDYGMFEAGERDKPGNRKRISAYLQSDCRYLWQMVTAFNKRFGDNLTQAGAAMKQWQKICKAEEIEPAERTDKEFYEAFAPYYYGGRVQCFEAGVIDTDFAVYDINSAYAYGMMQSHPYSANYERINGYADNADFYRVRCRSHGVFPFRGMGDSGPSGFGLSFPADDEIREYTVTSWEYRAAVDTRAISAVEVLESIRFARKQSFRAYIETFWNERKAAKLNNDTLTDIFCKLLMNSLYGKWAANPATYRNYIIVPPDQAHLLASEKSAFDFGGEIGPWVLGEKPLDEYAMRYYNVATGASITGFVRAMLWRAIHSCKGVLYCDTDSVAVRRKGAAVQVGERLGEWKLEGRFDRAGIAGKKLYIFRGEPDSAGTRAYKTASKGVRLTDSELWRVARGGAVDYTPEAPTFSIHKAPHFTQRHVIATSTARGKS